MNGGYAMINTTGLDLIKGSTEQTINGLFKAVENAMKTGKPIIAVGHNWDGKPMSPILTFAVRMTDDLFICTASTLQIYVNKTDVVTIVNMVGD